jgi:hypothetical protein
VTLEAGVVASAIVANPGILGRGFLACADAALTAEGTSTIASIVLDAAHPGRPPAAIPGTVAAPGHPGVVDRPPPIAGGPLIAGDSAEVGLTAKRVGDAWLVVQSNGTTGQRLAVLDRLLVGPIKLRPPLPAPDISYHIAVSGGPAGLREADQEAGQVPCSASRPFCTLATFFLHDWSLRASVILPAQLGLTLRAIPGHPSAYYGSLAHTPAFAGVWRRVGRGAWLVVWSGPTRAQELAISEALTVRRT